MLTASITEGNENACFTIDFDNAITYSDPNPTLAHFQVLSRLDRETKDFYDLTLTAFDLAPPYYNYSTKVFIKVRDENDNYPKFLFPGQENIYSTIIEENDLSNEPILHIKTIDYDLGKNAEVSFSLPISNDYFEVDKRSGHLRLLRPLDREEASFHVFKVEAADHGVPSLKSHAIVNITVSDVNDNAPTFNSENYKLRIPEDYPIGAFVVQIKAYDVDEDSDITYSFGYGDHHMLELDPETGVIHLSESLDYETQKVLNLSVIARDSATEPLSASTNVIIEITDVDENIYAPEFQNESQYMLARIPENKPVGSFVSKVFAVDYDEGVNGQVRYAIVGGSGHGRFSLNVITGEIHTLDSFDRETEQYYWLDIKAYDLAAVPKYSMLFLCVQVEDLNDNPPLPTMPVWHVRVLEEQPIATFVATISATDLDDHDSTQQFYYRIKPFSDGFHYFQVHDGLIRTKQVLDRESLNTDTFELEIEVSDDEFESTFRLISTARVVIHVEDTNDHSPELLYDVNEVFIVPPVNPTFNGQFLIHRVVVIDRDKGVNSELDYSVLRATARDMDDGQVVAMDISIDSFGHITSKSIPPQPVVIDLNINVTDRGTPANSKIFRVIINLEERPEQETDFLMIGQFIESEGRALGRAVSENTLGIVDEVSVFSSYEGENDYVKPVIIAGNEDNKFAIVGNSLVIAEELDCETKSEYSLVIAATDGIKFSANVTWPIRVQDVNEFSPMFGQKNYTIYVNENTHPGTSIYTLMASDLDCRNQVQFELESCLTPHSVDHFVVSVTGDIVLAARLDHETTRRHILRIRAMDTGGLPEKADYAYVTVLVEDANDNEPVFVTLEYDVKVFDTSAVGTVLTQVLAIDKDKGYEGLVTYRIEKGSNLYFVIDYESGEIRLNLELNQTLIGKTYTLEIVAVDETMRESREHAIVKILVISGENSVPYFDKTLYEVSVKENMPRGTLVFLVPCLSFSIVRFSIIEGDASEAFIINPSTGAISLKRKLDYEIQSQHKLEIEATNSAGLKAYTFVRVDVVDVNDNHPSFEQTHFSGTVSEGVPQGTVILSETEQTEILLVRATDLDSGSNGRIKFEILDEHAKKNFTIDPNTGSLRTRTVLDYEEQSVFIFKVAAHDLGVPPLFALTDAIVNITITDKNDCKPEFELPAYSVVLYQPTYDGVIVAQPKAFDLDSSAMTQFRYSIVNSDADDYLFSINPSTGVITATASRSMRRSYSLTIQVVDFPIDPLSALVTVHITVQEALGNYLVQQTEYNATIYENSSETQSAVRIEPKENYKHKTKLFRLRNHVDLFAIGLSNGILKTKEGIIFDREEKSDYYLQVEMRVTGIPHRALILIHVTVLDVNDNAPQFVRLPYRFGVKAGSPKSTLIGKVLAVDKDTGDNAVVSYSITKNFLSLFEINDRDGSLRTRNQVPSNMLQLDLHQFITVEARNKNKESMRTYVNVTLEFMPQEAPMFSKSEITVRIAEDTALNAQIAQFEAISSDSSTIFYTIEQGDRDQNFDINFLTGWVSITSKLDFEEGPRAHILIIRAWDSKVSHIYSNARLNVIVEDSNDSPPIFSRPVYQASISEGAASGSFVIKVLASDADSGENAILEYHLITSSGSENFQINKTSGVISTKRHLDREEEASSYSLIVQVHDGKHFDVTNVEISVSDINDCTPEFYHPQYNLHFDESYGFQSFCLGKVEAYDLDVVNRDSLFYEIKNGNEKHDLFYIDKQKGLLYIENRNRVHLDSFYYLNVTASDTVHTRVVPVYINVTTINRNAPYFEEKIYYPQDDIIEHDDTFITTPFFTLTAIDGDKGLCSELTYSLIGDRVSKTYKVDPKTGQMFLRAPVDREDPNLETEIRVMVSDALGRHAFTNVHVVVKDINDHSPMFELASYHTILYEPIPIGYDVVKVQAVDKDLQENSDVVYKLSPNQPQDIVDTFYVNSIDGNVFISRRIGNPEDIISYQFFVRASDKGSPPRTKDVPVDVYVSQSKRQRRDEEAAAAVATDSSRKTRAVPASSEEEDDGQVGPPVFISPQDKSVIELRETAPLGTVVFQVKTETKDTEPLLYSLMETPGLQLNAPDVFEINSTGAVIRKRFFDYQDAPNKITVVVVAKTSDAFVTSAFYYVQILDENNNAPKFESDMYSVSLPEDYFEISQSIDRHVITVAATDKDTGANRQIIYTMSGDDSNGYFEIERSTGRVLVKRSLDREHRDNFMLNIRAVDGGKPQLHDTTLLNITILDLNDNGPVFGNEAASKFEISEAMSIGSTVFNLQVSDKDIYPNNIVFYYIQNCTAFQNESSTEGNEDSKFSVNQTTGDVYVHGELDRETATRFELVVVATDGKFSINRTVRIIIKDENDNAPMCNQDPKFIKIAENEAIDTFVYDYSLSVIDIDAGANSKISFSLVVPDGAPHPPFSISRDSGILKVANKLDREVEDTYDLWIRATDGGGLFCTIKVTIILLDTNDNAPRFLGHSEAAVVGTYNINQLITKVRAIDVDLKENKTVEYKLIDSANGRFSIDSTSGMISLARLLDQSLDTYILKVEAHDQGVPRMTSTTELTIRVGNSKDKPPQFEESVYQVFVSEATKIHTKLLEVKALNADEHTEKFPISYSIVNGNDLSMFYINITNGSLYLNNNLDFEHVRSYQLEIYAIQINELRKPLSDRCNVLINVTDANDNAPYFPQAIIERDVPEDTQHGVSVYVAQALDRDFNSTLSYHLITKTPNFVITEDTGVIVVGSTLDYEQRTHFTLKIAAYDNGFPQLSGYMQLKINVLDVNDNPPRFEKDQYDIYISEDFPESGVLTLIKVTDLDGPKNRGPFSFSVVGDYSDKFQVDSNGVLSNTRKLVVGSYNFKVNVLDSGTPPVSNEVPVMIEVYKASTEPPTIFDHEVVIMIIEDTFPAGKIAELTAVDKDKHDKLSYRVHKNDLSPSSPNDNGKDQTGDGSLFFMQDRALLAQTNLDDGEYHVTVKVTDGQHTDTGNVTILVRKVSPDMLTNAVTIKMSEMTADDFLSAYFVLFQTLMTMTVFKSSNNIQVAVLSIQETSDHGLEILFCVFEKLPSGKELFVSREVVERTMDEHMKLMKPKLPIVKITSDVCSNAVAATNACVNNTVCSSVVNLQLKLGFESYRSYSAKRNSFVTLLHQWSTMCRCNPQDPYCVEKVCQNNPCGAGRKCIAVTETTFRCECLSTSSNDNWNHGGNGENGLDTDNNNDDYTQLFSNCDYKDEQPICTSPLCTKDSNPMSFSGSGFVHYEVPSVEKFNVISIRLGFRLDARVDNGELLSIFGTSDFVIIDVENGNVRLRTNKNNAVNGAKKFNDGIWHHVDAFYDGSTTTICVDNIYCASDIISSAAGGKPNVLLSSRMVFVADRMAKRQEISEFRKSTTFDTLTWSDYYRYFGCIDDIFINDVRLPNPVDLESNKHPSSVSVHHFKDVELKCNAALMTLSSCANNPCFNGGVCRGWGSTFECVCGDWASGSRCETLKTTCGLSPCKSGSICRTLGNSFSNYTCHCEKGIKGETCDSEEFCDPNPCLNGATCDDRPYSFNCQCTSGFYGDRCENDVNECLTMDTPCKNGGLCKNTIGGYECTCPDSTSGNKCELITEGAEASTLMWLFTVPFEILIAAFVVFILLFICVILLITCVKYRNTKRKLRQNTFPLMNYPSQYPTTPSHHSNQYMAYSKIMNGANYPPGYNGGPVYSPTHANNRTGSNSTITNHSYVSSSAFRLPQYSAGGGSSNHPSMIYYDKNGRPISPSNTISSSVNNYEHHKSFDDNQVPLTKSFKGLRVDLPEIGSREHISRPSRKHSLTSDSDQHYTTSCYMPVMQVPDDTNSSRPVATVPSSMVNRNRNPEPGVRLEDWEDFDEIQGVIGDEEANNLLLRRWGEERTTESPNLTDEPASSSNGGGGDYSRVTRRKMPTKHRPKSAHSSVDNSLHRRNKHAGHKQRSSAMLDEPHSLNNNHNCNNNIKEPQKNKDRTLQTFIDDYPDSPNRLMTESASDGIEEISPAAPESLVSDSSSTSVCDTASQVPTSLSPSLSKSELPTI